VLVLTGAKAPAWLTQGVAIRHVICENRPTTMPFVCTSCHREFVVAPATLARFPNWTPKTCMTCKRGTAPASSREENLTTAEVLEKYTAGPVTGVFTDGAATPNPGPGGWGAVYVVNDVIVAEQHGHEPQTTNNRMELSALIAGCTMVPRDHQAVIWTDSELCVNTITIWARRWEAKGWTKKGGDIKNLDLVQELYRLFHGHPGLQLLWIKAHSGHRWNEYADSLATAYRRQ
jgi:ribonuclease HI